MDGNALAKEVADIDSFLAEPKQLDGTQPAWIEGGRNWERECAWPIVNSLGVTRGHLKLIQKRSWPLWMTAVVIFRKRAIVRCEAPPEAEMHTNPPWALRFGLNPEVRGPHCHSWSSTVNKFWLAETGSYRPLWR